MRMSEKGRVRTLAAGWVPVIEHCPPSVTAVVFTKRAAFLDPGIGFSHRRRLGRGIAPSLDVSVAPPFTLWSIVFKSAIIFCDPLFLGGVMLYRL